MPSRYQPQLSGWSKDLSKTSGSGIISEANYIACANDNYLEIYRYRKLIGVSFILILMVFADFILISTFFHILFVKRYLWVMGIGVFCIIIIISVIIYQTLFNFLFAYFAPFSNPIRFNRKTGKVYLYETVAKKWMSTFWLPFSAFKDLKKYQIKVYDWADFHAVLQSSTGAFASGGTIEHHMLFGVACKPNSNEVIEYIQIGETNQLAYAWDWISHFMEYGTDRPLNKAGLRYIYYSRDDAKSFMDVEPRRKVTSRQIEGLDKASKAGSKEELAQIEQEYQLSDTVYPVY
ncbi:MULTISPECIES: DUF6708 domain-containing protein [unclassified Gilliamella]|uniref:DUF6708 domain-containing protein n=1 Tax=unclassified Gilliamella TaxID=2685620 RepID=UPI001322776D|nr:MULTISPECIES: DUF6708 domain-containing protein [unclassified Gilliamella]MWN31043.1 hypothetical protein [Gilliamella sp. Pra-s60]MWP28392.1 hypothetical protein [Gilliamella sp. Pra-s54]